MSDQEAPPVEERKVRRPLPVNVYAVMEDVLEKLKILDYENKFLRNNPSNPNLQPMTKIACTGPDATGGPVSQFAYFSALVAWLLAECAVHDFLPWTEYDNPNTVATTIITQVQNLGLSISLNQARIMKGYGDNVAQVLDFLTNKALQENRFQIELHPVYENVDYAEAAPMDVEAEINDDVIQDEVEDENNGVFNEDMETYGEKENTEDKKNTQDVVENTVDPVQWKLQLENVAPRLKWKPRADSLEWRTHLEQSEKHQKTIVAHAPDATVSLKKIGQQLSQVADRIAQKERHINQEFDHLGQEFRTKQKRLDEVTEYYNKLHATVTDYQNELQAKAAEIDLINAQMTNQSREFAKSPVRTMLQAIATIKKEIGAMELRIGILSQTLLHAKVRRPHE
jgi:estrogen-related receptor beta like 1